MRAPAYAMRKWATPFIRALAKDNAEIMAFSDYPTSGYVQWRERDPDHPLFHRVFYCRWKIADGKLYQVQKVASPEAYENCPEGWRLELQHAGKELEKATAGKYIA